MPDYVLQTDGKRTVLHEQLGEGFAKIQVIEAESWSEARAKVPQLAEQPAVPERLAAEPLFKSAHDAMRFAYQFADQQSPKTPMSTLMKSANIGTGKGLIALDGAGQAGMVLAALKHLTDEQVNVLTVRYGGALSTCQCCGLQAPTPRWSLAVDELSHCEELAGIPRPVRHAVIEKIVARRKILVGKQASSHGLSPRTLRHKMEKIKQRLGKIENSAMIWLEDYFKARGLLPGE